MPTYEYLCIDCGHEFEFFQSMKDEPLKECPSCDTGSVRRKIGVGAGIIFKGSGFYETDFKDRKGTKSPEGGDKSGESKPAESSGAAGSSGDAKPAAAAGGGQASSSTAGTKTD